MYRFSKGVVVVYPQIQYETVRPNTRFARRHVYKRHISTGTVAIDGCSSATIDQATSTMRIDAYVVWFDVQVYDRPLVQTADSPVYVLRENYGQRYLFIIALAYLVRLHNIWTNVFIYNRVAVCEYRRNSQYGIVPLSACLCVCALRKSNHEAFRCCYICNSLRGIKLTVRVFYDVVNYAQPRRVAASTDDFLFCVPLIKGDRYVTSRA